MGLIPNGSVEMPLVEQYWNRFVNLQVAKQKLQAYQNGLRKQRNFDLHEPQRALA
jgi:hypothetical protein